MQETEQTHVYSCFTQL